MERSVSAGGEGPPHGSFDIIREIGRGGTGKVYKVQNRQGTLGALKVPLFDKPLYRDLLRREMTMMAQLSSRGNQGVPAVLEIGLDAARPWYVMEFVDGPDLSSAGRRMSDAAGPRQLARPEQSRLILELVLGIARALAFVHGEGVVHGDVSPRNVILRGGTDPVLIDFGTALHAAMGQTARDVAQTEGLVVGTCAYMAPERILRRRLDTRCDLYSLGCIAFELLTGRPPFVADDDLALRNQHLSVPAPLPSTFVDGLPEGVDALIAKLVDKEPADRMGYAEEVVAAIERIVGGSGKAGSASPRAPLFRPRLIGREDVLDRLKAKVRSLRAGGGGVAYVSGESGIGKTRLANEIGAHASTVGADLVVANCAPGSPGMGKSVATAGLHAFRPLLLRIVDCWGNGSSEPLSGPVGRAIRVLARYEPSLDAIPNDEPAPAAPASSLDGRRSVLESLGTLIDRYAASKPLVLLIDDLQWADELTLEYLTAPNVGANDSSRVLVLATYRSDEADAVVRRLEAAPAVERIELQRLAADDTRALTRDMLGTRFLPQGLSDLIFKQSDGNPFFAAEYLRAAIARRLISWDSLQGWQLSDSELEPNEETIGAPDAVESLFAVRIAGLGPAARRLLDLAVIVGREFSWSWLTTISERASGLISTAGAAALEELIARQVVEDIGDGRCRFVHDQLRESWARRVPQDKRTQLHRAIAQTLESFADEGQAHRTLPTAGELGFHWAAAGEPERALSHLRSAASSAEETFATAQAAELYRLATRQVETLAAADPVKWSGVHREIKESFGDLLLRSAQHKEARTRYRAALDLTPPGERLARARLCRKIGESCWTLHEYDGALTELALAEDLLGPIDSLTTVDERREWIEIKYGRFSVKYLSRQAGDETLALIRELEPVIRVHGTTLQRTLFYQCATGDLLARGRYAYSHEAIVLARHGLAVSETEGQGRAQRAEARLTLGFAMLLGGQNDVAEAVGALAEALDEACSIGERTLATRTLAYLAIGARRLRDVARTKTLVDRLRRASEAASLAPYMGVAEACDAWVSVQEGDLTAAIGSGVRARNLWRSSAHPFPFRWLGCLALLQAHRGRAEWDALPDLIGDLLSKDQQLLPTPLDGALRRLHETSPDPKIVDEAIDAAWRLGYL
jgi:eukaryotic-like serine/threonine-protein kinase